MFDVDAPLQPVASTINTLAGALYKVFCASPDPARKEMREACFDYLSLGGVCSNGPISLLSGLNPRPLSLFLHFFAVAVYGVGRLLLPYPSPQKVWLGIRLLLVSNLLIYINFQHYSYYVLKFFSIVQRNNVFCDEFIGCIWNYFPNYKSRRRSTNVLPCYCASLLQSSPCPC